VAIVCDSLDQYGGAERIVSVLHELFPFAPVYTSFFNAEKMRSHGFSIPSEQVIIPKFGNSKFLLKFTKPLFFLYPAIFESFDFSKYDLVISSSTRFAHGIITPVGTKHICYMHSPARYAWDYIAYKNTLKLSFLMKPVYPFIVSWLRVWDKAASDRVDYLIANSRYTASRIKKFYRRDSTVITPFVDLGRFLAIDEEKVKRGYFLYIGRFTPWRHLEYMVQCFNKLGLPLRMVGNGDPKYIAKLRAMSKANIEIYEKQTDAEVVKHLSGCRALLWPGLEDFGIAPVEAQAAGKPVIAYGKGGTVDVVLDGQTGIFYYEQNVETLYAAVQAFQKMHFDPDVCRKQAAKFTRERFKKEMTAYIMKIMA